MPRAHFPYWAFVVCYDDPAHIALGPDVPGPAVEVAEIWSNAKSYTGLGLKFQTLPKGGTAARMVM